MLTDEQKEERRIARNARSRARYAEMQLARFERKFDDLLLAYSDSDRKLLKNVYAARNTVTGMLRAKAHWIINCWTDGQPKIGWRDDAREVIKAARATAATAVDLIG